MPLAVGLTRWLGSASGADSAILACMNARVDHFLQELLELPAAERSAVAAALLDSLSDEPEDSVSEAWRLELLQRRDALRSGRLATSSWADVRSRMGSL